MPVRATWNGLVVAESENTVVVEGNHYFPPEDVRQDLLRPDPKVTWCPWKGHASHLTLANDGGEQAPAAAWTYPEPKRAAKQIAGRIAFYRPPVDVQSA
jgi:uncharacterized protein (DUF427 family)